MGWQIGSKPCGGGGSVERSHLGTKSSRKGPCSREWDRRKRLELEEEKWRPESGKDSHCLCKIGGSYLPVTGRLTPTGRGTIQCRKEPMHVEAASPGAPQTLQWAELLVRGPGG